ncbi:MAG: AMP-binding protein [Hyphomicrobiaceae bacterium]|nr:AMP-binding protein [Hyphomicrobiaceae bacterium]
MSGSAILEARDFLIRHRTDYETAYRGFRWPELGSFNWAIDWFDAQLGRGAAADRRALQIVGNDASEVSFAELSERSSRIASGLRALGVRRGDRILLMLGNVQPLWETMLAAMKLGAVVIPATTLLAPSDLSDRVGRGRVKHLVIGAADAPKLAGLAEGVTRIVVGEPPGPGWHSYADLLTAPAAFTPDGATDANDPLLLYFTSGTTARPKLVLHSHKSYALGHLSGMYWIGLKPGDVHLNISSPGWAKHAWSSVFIPWISEATAFVLNQPRFSARSLLEAITANGVTTLCAPPTVWRMVIQEDLGQWRTSLREVLSAGEPLNPEVIERVRAAWDLTIRDGYGQTETTLQIGNPPGLPVKPGSMGKPMPGYRFELLAPDGRNVDEGEIAIPLDDPPAGLMRGYQGDDGTVVSLSGKIYRTGDVALRDEDGYFTYVGRADDVFKASDYRISPFELESAMIEHEAVAEAAVVPAPDAIRTAVPKAFIALAPGFEPTRETALSIFRHSRVRLAPYKRVRRIEFFDLPKTISGKIRRVELRRREEEAFKSGVRPPSELREEDFPELG